MKFVPKGPISIGSDNGLASIRQQAIIGIILGLRPANERWHYFVMTSFIGWVQA